MFENKRNEADDCKQYPKTLGYTTKWYNRYGCIHPIDKYVHNEKTRCKRSNGN